MAFVLQPSDWYEHDNKGKYVIDVFGRKDAKTVVCIRITDFKPYFYSSSSKRPENATKVQKYDMMGGFNDLQKIDVWRIESTSKAKFHEAVKKGDLARDKLYESNLHPFLRMFHERDIGPASPIQIRGGRRINIPVDEETEEPTYNVDEMYECPYTNVCPAPDANIPLLVACYDLEMYSKSGLFPRASIDPIVQIGVSYRWSNAMLDPIRKTVFVFGTVTPSTEPLTTFVSCHTETEMLNRFHDQIMGMNPDVMCGYNTFGFDDAYIEDRCASLGIIEEMYFSRCPPTKKMQGSGWVTKFSETKKFELASGKYDLRMITMQGRLGVDLLLNMRREHSLDSFKLDNVASTFLRDKVLNYREGRVVTKSTRGLINGNYVKFDVVGNTSDPYQDGRKFQIKLVDSKGFTIDGENDLFADLTDKERASIEWTFTKDDVEPHELFRLHAEGGPDGRARIAKYCIQDCDLVLTLMAKLDTLVNARGMADVCKVPMQYVLTRGLGVRIFSAVVFFASQRDQIIQTQHAFDGDSSYEGAVVISPKIGMYLDQPITVLDFNSLYPTNMISYNLSPDTLVCERTFDDENHKTSHYGMSMENMAKLEDKGYVLEEIDYDTKDDDGKILGKTICTFVQPIKDGNPMLVGVLPKTLDILLKKRKEFKEKMEDNKYDEAQRSVFNGLQLAYKVVANSVYGQTGSRTSAIRKLCVAACTTSAGRKALYTAKRVVEKEFNAEVVYGDTDSIFIKFPTKDLAESIQLGVAAGKVITKTCGRTYKIAYEKTFLPFILFCRKRYVGMKYEEDPNPAKAKRMSMGIVLKRRDNAPIVKDIFGGALDVLLSGKDVKEAQAFTNDMLLKVLENKIPLEKYIVSKSLRDDYKNPEQIAHRVLADRMAARDPGTAPKVGDRIQYIVAAENKNKVKQGDRIENVDYIRSKKLTPDTEFYITNQIQNPVSQLFALCIEQLDGYIAPQTPSYKTLYQTYMEKFDNNEEEATLALLKKKEQQIEKIMFLQSPHLAKIVRGNVRGPMDAFVRRV